MSRLWLRLLNRALAIVRRVTRGLRRLEAALYRSALRAWEREFGRHPAHDRWLRPAKKDGS